MENFETINLFGLNFLNLQSEEEAASFILLNWERSIKVPVVFTPNAYQIVEFDNYPKIKKFLQNSDFILPDGIPIVWISKLKRNSLSTRLTGSGTFPFLWKALKEKNEKVLLVVSNDKISEIMKKDFEGCYFETAPIFKSDYEIEVWSNTLRIKVEHLGIRFVFVGLGFPKQEQIAYFFFKMNPDKKVLFFLFGASMEFYCGLKKRAPQIWRSLNLEWLFRFLQEPKRLWRRYTIGNYLFIIRSFKEWMRK
jgi:N-acetylglucosaminyldiphosphoundecaprenol N-acetyl-beta-D-mannosaminyltransferase